LTLYLPRHFAGDAAAARELIAEHPFATLVTAGAKRTPNVTHLPLLLDGDALVGHVARVNPHWRAFADGVTVAVFHGPHAFVSRGWYADPADNVPTWNYATVHVSGKPELCDARNAVEKLAARFEPPSLPPIAESKMARLVEAIVAFRLPLTRMEVKLKLSQNKSAKEVDGLIAGLEKAGEPGALATAARMQRERG
jgi:transcriptional regulator